MAVLKVITVKESIEELQGLLKKASVATRPRIKMLLLIQKGVLSTQELAAKTGVSMNSVGNYKKLYQAEGLEALLTEKRGGHKQGAITKEAHAQIREHLSNPKAGFTSYKQAQQWINEHFDLQMKYHAVNKYLKHHFHTRLKAGRKTHVHKDPLAEAAFKKGARW